MDYKYKNPALSPEERAEDLLSIMTLEEKVAQIDILRGVEYATVPNPVNHCCVHETSDVDYEKFKSIVEDDGIVHVDCIGSCDFSHSPGGGNVSDGTFD